MHKTVLAVCIFGALTGVATGQQFVNKNSDALTQLYLADAPPRAGEETQIADAMLAYDPNTDTAPSSIDVTCSPEIVRVNKKGKRRAAVSDYIIHRAEWSVNADGTYSLLTSQWFVYKFAYNRKAAKCSLSEGKQRANGDPLLYAVHKTRFVGVNHFNYKIHKKQVLVAYKAYATPVQAENITNLGTLAAGLLGISNVTSLGSLGFSYSVSNDFADRFVVVHDLAGLQRLPFDFNVVPFVNVTGWSLTLADANVSSPSSVSILSPAPDDDLPQSPVQVRVNTSVPLAGNVKLYLDNALVSTLTTVGTPPPYNLPLDLSSVTAGLHTLTVGVDDTSAPPKPTYSAPIPITVAQSVWPNCGGQPYDQILNLLPPGTALNFAPVDGSIPSDFRLIKIGPDWHLCGYPSKQGTYNVLVQNVVPATGSAPPTAVNYAAFELSVQGGGGSPSSGPSMSVPSGNGGGPGGGGKGAGKGAGSNGPGGGGQNPSGSSAQQPNQQGALPTVTVVDCSALSSSSPCSFNHTFRSLDREYWDFSLAVTVPGVRQTKFSTPANPPTVTTHTDAYAMLDLYPAARWFTKEQAFPHVIVGMPITSQPFYRPAFGAADSLTSWTGLEKRGFPIRIGFFGGVVYMKQQYLTGSPITIAQHRIWKGVFGFEVPVTALASAIKGAASGSQSAKGSSGH